LDVIGTKVLRVFSSLYSRISGGLQVPVHHGGQVVQVVGGNPLEVHGGRGLRGGTHIIWVAMFGVPSILTSDPGRQFTFTLWEGLTKLLGIKHVQTTAYLPQSNGMVERTHGQLKAALRARLAGSRWPEHLPWVLLGLRTAPQEDSGILAAELVYGAALALPAEFLSTGERPATDFLKMVQQVEMPASGLLQASQVYVRRGGTLTPLSSLYVGPYEVLERADKFFQIAVGGREEMVSIDRLKPHLGAGRPSRRHAAAPLSPLL
jgi:hypothetical protein